MNETKPVEVKNVSGFKSPAALLEAFLEQFKKDDKESTNSKEEPPTDVFLDLGGTKLTALDDW